MRQRREGGKDGLMRAHGEGDLDDIGSSRVEGPRPSSTGRPSRERPPSRPVSHRARARLSSPTHTPGRVSYIYVYIEYVFYDSYANCIDVLLSSIRSLRLLSALDMVPHRLRSIRRTDSPRALLVSVVSVEDTRCMNRVLHVLSMGCSRANTLFVAFA